MVAELRHRWLCLRVVLALILKDAPHSELCLQMISCFAVRLPCAMLPALLVIGTGCAACPRQACPLWQIVTMGANWAISAQAVPEEGRDCGRAFAHSLLRVCVR